MLNDIIIIIAILVASGTTSSTSRVSLQTYVITGDELIERRAVVVLE